MFVCCECRVLSGSGLCDELINRTEESYRLWCVIVWSRNLKNEEAMVRVAPQRHGAGGGGFIKSCGFKKASNTNAWVNYRLIGRWLLKQARNSLLLCIWLLVQTVSSFYQVRTWFAVNWNGDRLSLALSFVHCPTLIYRFIDHRRYINLACEGFVK